jgi:hypothetical protein
MWTTEYIFSQIFAILAITLLVSTYFMTNKKTILIFAMSSSLCYSIQFLLLGAYTGSVINIVGIVRAVWFYVYDRGEKPKQKSLFSLIFLEILVLLCGILTYTAWYCFLPIMLTEVYTYSIWQNNIKVYRWLAPIVSLGGVLYNIFCMSIFGIVAESMFFVSTIVAIIQMYVLERKKNLEIKKQAV